MAKTEIQMTNKMPNNENGDIKLFIHVESPMWKLEKSTLISLTLD